MEIWLAEQRALVFDAQISMDLARERAWSRKLSAFGALGRVGALFQRPRDEDFELVYEGLRYEPMWHVACRAHVVYDRDTQYQLPVGGPEVKGVLIAGTDYELMGGRLSIPGIEHCAEEAHAEAYLDGVSGQQAPKLGRYLKFPAWPIPNEEVSSFAPPEAIVLGTSVAASAAVRQVLASMSKQIQANLIVEEGIEIQALDLYLRPMYAFAVRWTSKGRTGIIECDALTTDISPGGKTYEGYTSEPLDPAILFDVSADQVAEVIPGGRVFIAPAGVAVAEQEPEPAEAETEWEEQEPEPAEPEPESEQEEEEPEPGEDWDEDVTHDV